MNMVVLGDSIAKGTYTAIGDDSPNIIADPNFSQIIKKKLKLDGLINYSINGISISKTSPINGDYSLTNICKTTEKADIILISAGTNDYATNVILGKKKDKTDCSFYGAIYELFEFIKNERKDSKVFVFLPMRRKNDGKNAKGYNFYEYRRALRIMSQEYGFCIIDGYDVKIFPKREDHKLKYIYDGLHINENGHRLVGNLISRKIKKELALTCKK